MVRFCKDKLVDTYSIICDYASVKYNTAGCLLFLQQKSDSKAVDKTSMICEYLQNFA